MLDIRLASCGPCYTSRVDVPVVVMLNLFMVTERRDPVLAAPNDPRARALSYLSGVFDLRAPDGSIMATDSRLTTLRATQARFNSGTVLDTMGVY